MKIKTDTSLEEIESLVKQGLHDQSWALLEKGRLQKLWTTRDTIWAADLYKRIGNVALAIKILPDEVSKNDLENQDKTHLFAQIRLAEILNFVGAKYVSQRIIDKTLTEFKRRQINLEYEYPECDFHIADIYLSWGNFESAMKLYEKVSLDSELGDYRNKLAIIGKTDCLAAMGNYEQAINTLVELKQKILPGQLILTAIVEQAIGEYCFKNDCPDLAEQFFEASHIAFGENLKTKDFAYLLKWHGALKLNQNKIIEATKLFSNAFEILNQHLTQPMALIDLIYWLEKSKDFDLELGMKVAARCHYTNSPASFLLGRQLLGQSKYPIPTWYEQRFIPHTNDCWIIEKNTISPMNYEQLSFSSNIIDLMSGCIVEGQQVRILSELQLACLTAIISTGSMGIHEIALIDFVYRQELFHLESGEERIKELIQTLKSFGIKIAKTKNYYRYDLNVDCAICFPMDMHGIGPWALLKKSFSVFRRQDLENYFGLGTSTSKEVIAKWLKLKLIFITGAGPSTKYHF